MRYEGSIYRPPSEAGSLILQVTIGCAHNRCTFCSMYKDKNFRIRPLAEVLEDLEAARSQYRRIEKVFLADGDALVLPNASLLAVLGRIRGLFPECRRVGIYGSPGDVLRKTPAELQELRDAGLGIVYIGAESGSDRILEAIRKGATAAELVDAVRRLEDNGLPASVTFISGLGGQDHWEEHAIESGRMISRMSPSYVGLLTLMVEPGTQLYDDVRSGRFQLLDPMQVLAETALLLQNTEVASRCVFRSNHASNYLSLKGDLPRDKAVLLAQIAQAMAGQALLKDERFRML